MFSLLCSEWEEVGHIWLNHWEIQNFADFTGGMFPIFLTSEASLENRNPAIREANGRGGRGVATAHKTPANKKFGAGQVVRSTVVGVVNVIDVRNVLNGNLNKARKRR